MDDGCLLPSQHSDKIVSTSVEVLNSKENRCNCEWKVVKHVNPHLCDSMRAAETSRCCTLKPANFIPPKSTRLLPHADTTIAQLATDCILHHLHCCFSHVATFAAAFSLACACIRRQAIALNDYEISTKPHMTIVTIDAALLKFDACSRMQ